jgi:outer membrane protein
MKKTLFLALAIVFLMAFMAPQERSVSVVHVDTQYILNKIPAYKDAQKQLETLAQQYKSEIDAKARQVDSLFNVYQQNEVLMTPEMKMRLKQQIMEKDKEVKQLQKKYFGPDGLLAKKREELMKPIMDNIYQAVKQMAQQNHIDYVFDKATGNILYANPLLDKSDIILKQLGY